MLHNSMYDLRICLYIIILFVFYWKTKPTYASHMKFPTPPTYHPLHTHSPPSTKWRNMEKDRERESTHRCSIVQNLIS